MHERMPSASTWKQRLMSGKNEGPTAYVPLNLVFSAVFCNTLGPGTAQLLAAEAVLGRPLPSAYGRLCPIADVNGFGVFLKNTDNQ